MSVRAKFQCVSIKDFGSTGKLIELTAVYSNNQNEDNQFSKYTPSGKLEMMVTNDDASIQFKPGNKYYLDFSEAPE